MKPKLEEVVAAYRSGTRLPCCGWQGGCGGCFKPRHEDMRRLGLTEGIAIEEAIRRATSSVYSDTNTMHPHQRRLGRTTVMAAAPALLRISDLLQSAASFHEILSSVDQALGHKRGIGKVAIYDFSDRIAFALGLTPERIYLHAGVITGAKALAIDVRSRSHLEPSELPKPLQVLSAAELEDVLCIYKDCF